jgi:nitrogen fixation protein
VERNSLRTGVGLEGPARALAKRKAGGKMVYNKSALVADKDYEDCVIHSVCNHGNGEYTITFSNGWSLYITEEVPVIPFGGMPVRLYGRGIGSYVRGVVIDGHVVYYRTAEEDQEYRDAQMYCKDATEWLRRWDSGESVWSVEMGGLGPGYEQAIQITAAEILRDLLNRAIYDYRADKWETDEDQWVRDRDCIEKHVCGKDPVKKLGLSGAQWGAALSLAINLYRRTPIVVLTDPAVKGREIRVSRTFPQG